MRTGPLAELTIEAARQTIALVDASPRRRVFYRLGDQLLDQGTSSLARAPVAELRIAQAYS